MSRFAAVPHRRRRPVVVAVAVVAVTAALVVALARSDSPALADVPVVAVFPSPGSVDASPTTQITVRGIVPGQIGAIQVTGAHSGAHTGRWASDSDGQGASFLPSKPFAAGELVTVRTGLSIAGVSGGTFSFTVGRPVPIRAPYFAEYPLRRASDVLRFRSRRDLAIPRLTVDYRASRVAPGYLLIAPKMGPGQDGPEIVDDGGQPVWFHPLRAPEQASDFRLQTYRGAPVLTWWQGPVWTIGAGAGEDRIVDSHYRTIGRVRGGNGYRPDLHEFRITRQNTALVVSLVATRWDLSSVHGPRDGVVIDSIVQEIDIPTGLVLFEWHSLGHVPLAQSNFHPPRGQPWDYFHVNSADDTPDGDILIGARDTSAVYLVDHRTGAIRWQLGGARSGFHMASGTTFHFQHDAQVQPDGTVTLFDDEAAPRRGPASRALRLRLDLSNMTASVVSAFTRPGGLLASSQGNAQWLPDGDVLVGWGNHAFLSEFDSRGHVDFDAHMPPGDQSYRAYRFPWSGQPLNPPAVATSRGRGGAVTVYASWNGATTVSGWRVLGGSGSRGLRRVGGLARTGFETAIGVEGHPRYVAVQALDGKGKVLGTSHTVRVR